MAMVYIYPDGKRTLFSSNTRKESIYPTVGAVQIYIDKVDENLKVVEKILAKEFHGDYEINWLENF